MIDSYPHDLTQTLFFQLLIRIIYICVVFHDWAITEYIFLILFKGIYYLQYIQMV